MSSHAHRYSDVKIAGPVICFDKDSGGLVGQVASLHDKPFAETVNEEIRRLDGYYRACSDWLNNAARAQRIAEHLEITEPEYAAIAKEEKYLSNHVLERMRSLAADKGHAQPVVSGWEDEASLVSVKNIARQRMLMMQSVLHSTPVIMRDPFAGQKAGEYGFGDGKTTQIFEGKASVGDMKFSAVASPKLHGYTFRFAVCNVPKDGYHDHNPAMILDSRIADNLEQWNRQTRGDATLAQNPLMSKMADSLYPNVHDWIHSWLLYDVQAKSDSFKQWGADIFFNVDHLVKNKLVINYEMLSMSLHRYVWNTMFDKNPQLKEQLYENLESYLDQAHQFGQWVAEKDGPKAGKEQEEYMAYAVLSNISFILDPKEERMARIMDKYPPVRDQIQRILGKALDLLHSDIRGVPSQFKAGDIEEVAGYVMRYPMADEIKAQLKKSRIGAGSGEAIAIGGDPKKRIYTENMAEYEALPVQISSQIHTIRDSSTYGMLNKALAKIPEALREEYINRIILDDAGRMFFRVHRAELDLEQTDLRTQDKRVLLVQVPKGQKLDLHPRVQVNLLEEVKRQQTVVTDKDVVAFNVSDAHVAAQILAAGHGSDIPLMIKKAKDLAVSGIEGADDIYPLLAQKAQQLFQFKDNGFYESLGRERFAARGAGPLIMKLQDGSDQKLFNGVVLYIPFDKEKTFNNDPDPDLHFIEQKDFRRTHKEPSGTAGLKTIALKADSRIAGTPENMRDMNAFLEELQKINHTIDFGPHKHLAKGLFT